MKRLTTILLIAALLMSAVSALAAEGSAEPTARSVVPADAELLRTRTDDGLTVYHFRTPDGASYEVDLNPADDSVVHVDMNASNQRGGTSVVLNPEQAEQALLKTHPDVNVYLVYQEKDDGRYQYELYFNSNTFIGRAELNAETGALMEYELDYSAASRVQAKGPLTAEQAKELALSLVAGGRVVEFETEREDGRKVYEGEIRGDNANYEFVIDAETGRITEWEVEKR